MWVEIVLIIVMTVLNGFFAASEIAVVSSRKGRLEQQVQAGNRGAEVALQLAESPNRFLSTVQVGITIISTLAAAFGGERLADPLAETIATTFPVAASYAPGIALGLVVALISYLSLIIGELVPKRLALQRAETIAATVAIPMRTIATIAAPFVTFLTFSTELVLRLLGQHRTQSEGVTEDDILALVREGTADGTVEASEHEFISSVFTFTDRNVRSLMTPRTQVVAIDIETPFTQVLDLVSESGYSRLPIYQDTLDQIVGILYVKDLLKLWRGTEAVDLRAVVRVPLYVPESQRAVLAFQHMKTNHTSLAIVLDEYGQVSGLVTIEDMLEELVGDIGDEYDERNTSAVVRREDGSYLVDGLLPFENFRSQIPLPNVTEILRDHDFETVAGFILVLLGRIPAVGDIVKLEDYIFEIIDMDGRRIDKILVRLPDALKTPTSV
jgi:putative hemolysin